MNFLPYPYKFWVYYLKDCILTNQFIISLQVNSAVRIVVSHSFILVSCANIKNKTSSFFISYVEKSNIVIVTQNRNHFVYPCFWNNIIWINSFSYSCYPKNNVLLSQKLFAIQLIYKLLLPCIYLQIRYFAHTCVWVCFD